MKKVEFTRWLFSSLLLLLLVLPSAAAGDEVIAEVENLGDTLVFHPVVQFKELILTVTGPCGYEYRQVVPEGEPIFRLDATTIDGAYRYNLFREEPIDPGIVKILQEARLAQNDEVSKALCRAGKLPGPPQVQAAGFQIFRGEIVYDPGSVEKSLRGDSDVSLDELLAMKPDTVAGPGNSALPTKDFVINDDLIVDGSACIGFDCVNGESFGFDTIRLKENNLRIKFDDTSTVASFPRNDWQLTANDSANGGLSKFSIDDISGSRTPFTIEANARSHSLYVDDGGRIGSRTSTPSVEIHTIDGDTPTLRLQQDGSSGFAPQTWDVAGNETNFFVRDVTNGSTLPFRIRPGAPSSSIFIDVDGDVGLGTSSPNAGLHVLIGGSSLTPSFATNLLLQNNANAGDGVVLMLIGGDGAGGNAQIAFGSASNDDEGLIVYRPNNDDMRFFTNGAIRATLNNTGLDVVGTLTTDGSCSIGCDRVFEPGYELESIGEHASYMWENNHLPGVGPTPEEGKYNLTQKTLGMLNELEKAHIYIDQLHDAVTEQKATLASQQELIQQLAARLAALEKGN